MKPLALLCLAGLPGLGAPAQTAVKPAPRVRESLKHGPAVVGTQDAKLFRGDGPGQGEDFRLSICARVKVLSFAMSGDGTHWAYVDSGSITGRKNAPIMGWTRLSNLIPPSRFRKVTHWTGPSFFRVEGGDYAGEYHFKGNGRFLLNNYGDEPQADDHGQLYIAGSLIWAKGDGPGKSMEDFFFRDDKRLRWSTDPSYAADWP